jgi:hypothetical protein
VVGIRRRRGYRSIAVEVPFAVVAMVWRGEHCAFVAEEYIRNGGSVITTQRAFLGVSGTVNKQNFRFAGPCIFFLHSYQTIPGQLC